jgi:hypothetical protein
VPKEARRLRVTSLGRRAGDQTVTTTDSAEKDVPPAGTPCFRCKELGHFCQSTEFIDDSEDALCEACLEAEDCPVILSRRNKVDCGFDPENSPEPVRSIPVPDSVGPSPDQVSEFMERVAARILQLQKGQSAGFAPPEYLTRAQFQFAVRRKLDEYPARRFDVKPSPDGRNVIVASVKSDAGREVFMQNQTTVPPQESRPTAPTSKEVASKGIRTARDFVDFMGALMADVVADRIEPAKAQAACSAADRMLKAVEMQRKYGLSGSSDQDLIPQKRLPAGE